MITYQDYLKVKDNDLDRAAFASAVVSDYKNGEFYKTAETADTYYRRRNKTIVEYQQKVATVGGEMVIDNFAANHKMRSSFYARYISQLSLFLLGNGAKWENAKTEEKLGAKFSDRLLDACQYALCGGVSYGFWNLDHMEVFSPLEFAPIYDEETGALRAGVRFWQIDKTKPKRATLYTEDGYINYIWSADAGEDWTALGNGIAMIPKRPYILRTRTSVSDGVEIVGGENYPTFPIVPYWSNKAKQSDIVGLQAGIDTYDMIANGYANDLDNAQLYWLIYGAGGMDDLDLQQFLDRLRTVKAAAPAVGQEVKPVTVEIPYQARERLLDRIERQLYRDAMILDTEHIASGANTATQIRAAYEPQNCRTDELEYCTIAFVQGILELAGIDDNPTFTRSIMVNKQEEINALMSAATALDEEYVTRKVLELLGDGDQADEIINRRNAEAIQRLGEPEPEE